MKSIKVGKVNIVEGEHYVASGGNRVTVIKLKGDCNSVQNTDVLYRQHRDGLLLTKSAFDFMCRYDSV